MPLEDDGTQLAELARGLPPGARILPQRITPAVARARWRLQQRPGWWAVEGCPSALVHGGPQVCGPCRAAVFEPALLQRHRSCNCR